MIWVTALYVLIAANIAVTLANFWFVYGIWPVSWKMFILFGFIAYGMSELTKYVVRNMVKWWEERI